MTSTLRAEASRLNGAKGRGPSTRKGKTRSSANAFRHGLSSAEHSTPTSPEVEAFAKALVGNCSDPALFEQAIYIAESELRIARIQALTISAIQRAVSRAAGSFSSGLRGVVKAIETVKELYAVRWAIEKHVADNPSDDSESGVVVPEELVDRFDRLARRTEAEAVFEAARDVLQFARYERRAYARRRKGVMEFIRLRYSHQNP